MKAEGGSKGEGQRERKSTPETNNFCPIAFQRVDVGGLFFRVESMEVVVVGSSPGIGISFLDDRGGCEAEEKGEAEGGLHCD